jgi:hypothetical protein
VITYSLVMCVGGLGILAALIVAVWCGSPPVSLDTYRGARTLGAFVIAVHAGVAIWRLTQNVALPRTLSDEFIPELVGYLTFWLLFPPLWFFLEYYAVDSGAIRGLSGAEADMKRMKDYTDLASKIWAAVIAILVGLVALKT